MYHWYSNRRGVAGAGPTHYNQTGSEREGKTKKRECCPRHKYRPSGGVVPAEERGSECDEWLRGGVCVGVCVVARVGGRSCDNNIRVLSLLFYA